MLAVGLIAMALAVLPAVVAVGAATSAVGQVALSLGSLVAVVGGVKLVAVMWGLLSHLAAESQGRRAATVVD
jgi:hypothetical protein